MNDLNQDFEKAVTQINAKLTEAANAIREAKRLAKEAGVPGLFWTNENDFFLDEKDFTDLASYDKAVYDLEDKMEMIDIESLESAMEDAGWSMSSSHC